MARPRTSFFLFFKDKKEGLGPCYWFGAKLDVNIAAISKYQRLVEDLVVPGTRNGE